MSGDKKIKMDKQEKTQKRDKLTSDFDNRINFLTQQINNLTIEFNAEVKKRQDEIDLLTLQSEALKTFKIK